MSSYGSSSSSSASSSLSLTPEQQRRLTSLLVLCSYLHFDSRSCQLTFSTHASQSEYQLNTNNRTSSSAASRRLVSAVRAKAKGMFEEEVVRTAARVVKIHCYPLINRTNAQALIELVKQNDDRKKKELIQLAFSHESLQREAEIDREGSCCVIS